MFGSPPDNTLMGDSSGKLGTNSMDDTSTEITVHDQLCELVRRLEKEQQTMWQSIARNTEAIEEFHFESRTHAVALAKLNKDLVSFQSSLSNNGFTLEPGEPPNFKHGADELALDKLHKDIKALRSSLYTTDTELQPGEPAASHSGSATVHTHARADSPRDETSCSVNSAVEALSIELKSGLQELQRQCDNEMKARIHGDEELQRKCDNEMKGRIIELQRQCDKELKARMELLRQFDNEVQARIRGDEEVKLVVLELHKSLEANGNVSL